MATASFRLAGDTASLWLAPRYGGLCGRRFLSETILAIPKTSTGPGGSNPTVIDISSTIDIKINALLEHRSQVGSDNPERVEVLTSRVKERANNLGKEFGVEFAEIFRYISLGR